MDTQKIPQHVAIIMDGNGRWAERRKMPRTQGHLEGVKRVAEIVDVAVELGIKVLTLYTFSQENWKRPEAEVSMLMQTICKALDLKSGELMRLNIQLRFIGRREGVPAHVLKQFERTAKLTSKNTGLILNLAFNYSSRTEILDGVRKVVEDVKAGAFDLEDLDEESFSRSLYTKGLPDPDLLIRTSGEQRISNFLLWQLSYAEFYFAESCWPDFTGEEFRKAIAEYQHRERRFGDVAGV
ncbi:MAG TPA: isoprenyl transferase [Candidatus Omnitrophota bacterium]|nr:isoprenyl transferase [Candidatus Omnitrophota bacterium]